MKLSQPDFLKKFMPFAVQSQVDKGIDKWVTLSQAGLESAWGASEAGANNIFGMKSFNPKEGRELVITFEVNASDKCSPSQVGLVDIISVQPSINYPGKFIYKGHAWFKTFTSYTQAFDWHSQIFFKNPDYADALKVKDQPQLFVQLMAPHYAPNNNLYANTVLEIMRELKAIPLNA